MTPGVYTTQETAKRLRMSARTLERSVARGDCPIRAIRVGRVLRFVRADVDRLLEVQDQGGAE